MTRAAVRNVSGSLFLKERLGKCIELRGWIEGKEWKTVGYLRGFDDWGFTIDVGGKLTLALRAAVTEVRDGDEKVLEDERLTQAREKPGPRGKGPAPYAFLD